MRRRLCAAPLALLLFAFGAVPAFARDDCPPPVAPAAPTCPTVEAPATRAEAVDRSSRPARVSLVRPVDFQSQLSEPPPPYWTQPLTPYCAAAAAIMVMRDLGIPHGDGALAHTFEIGRTGNTTNDPGLDPYGIAFLMRAFGGEGRIHAYASPHAFIDEIVGRLNNGVTAVALSEAGGHAVTVFGYDADRGGDVTGLYVADPLTGFAGRVGVDEWFSSVYWMGERFRAPGPDWQGTYVFVTYRDFR